MTFDPTPPPLSPAARRGIGWIAPLAGGAGLVLLLLLAMSEAAKPGPIVLAAIGLAAVTVILTLRADRLLRRAPSAQPGGREGRAPAPTPALAALDALPDPIMVVAAAEADDIAGRRVVFANRASRELFRIGEQGAHLITVMRDPDVIEALDEALFGEVERSTPFLLAGARDRQWRAFARPLPADGHQRQALLHLHDETDLHTVEQTRVDFLANASHELRSPLASLIGFIETLRGPARDDPEARERFLDIMAAQADRMGRLISDLLSLSRIELNEHVPPMGSADLTLIAGDVIDSLAPLMAEREVRLELGGAEPGRARITGDRDQIVQVIQNLVDNAVKYSPRGGVVRLKVEDDFATAGAAAARGGDLARFPLLTPDRTPAARYAAIRISDAGPGIARENMPRLTERFYRVEGQKSGARLGTGLGLAIVKHIVNRHRGGVVVESAPGQGTTFTVYLPHASAAARKSTASDDETSDRNKTVA